MKLHTCVLILVVAWGMSISRGQTAAPPPPMLPAAIKSTPVPPVDIITNYVGGHVQNLVTATDPAAQSASRDALIQGAASPGTGPTPPTFLDAYTLLLHDALKPHLNDQDLRIRLNIAIVLCRVSEKAESPRLVPLIKTMLDDPSDAVVLWAVKACKYAMVTQLKNPGGKGNIPADLANAVTKHPTSGPIAAEAYEALNLPTNSPGIAPAMLATSAEEMCKLMAIRITQYKTGIPDEPGAEASVALFLSNDKVWSTLSAAQQLQVVQSLSDLINVMAQQANAGGANATRRVLDPMQTVAAAIYVIGVHTASVDLQNAAAPLTKGKLAANATGATLMQRTLAVTDALKKVPAFSKIQPPPTIESSGPQTAAATTEPSK